MDDVLLAGRYRLEESLGKGGMGRVERAYDTVSNRPVAIKFLHVDDSRTDATAFSWEVQAVARLNHRGLLALYDYGRASDGRPYIVMELSGGVALNRIAKEHITWPCLCSILVQILEVLAHAHARGVFHHDLKPSNILVHLDRAGFVRVQVIDFGIAAVRDPQLLGKGEGPTTLIGTANYMAPEAIRSFSLFRFSPGLDLYALGVVAYELAYGERPFRAEDTRELLRQHQVMEPPVRPLRVELHAPPEYGDFVRRLLAKSPRDRYGSASEALHELSALAPSDALRGRVAAPGIPHSRYPEIDGEKWRGERGQRIQGDHFKLLNVRPPPFAGREKEQAFLWGRLTETTLSKQPSVVLLTGASGVGLSRLVQETAQRASEAGRARIAVVPYSLSRSDSAEGWRAALLTLMGYSGVDREQFAQHISDDLRWLGLSEELDRDVVLDLLFPTTDAFGSESLELEQRYDWVGTYLRLLGALAARGAVTIVLEDWCRTLDSRGVELLEFVLRAESPFPAFVVVSCRHEVDNDRSALDAMVRRLETYPGFYSAHVGPLQATAMGQLLSGIMPLQEPLAQALIGASEGYPVFAVELLRFWVSQQGLERRDGAYVATDPSAELPESVAEIWHARIDAIAARDPKRKADGASPVTDILARAAVLGQPFSFATLRELASVEGRSDLKGAMGRAWSTWHEEGLWQHVAPGRALFMHSSLREAVLRQVSLEAQRAIHRHCAIARLRAPISSPAAEILAVANHYESANLPAEAFPFYMRAAREALRAGRHWAALEHCRSGAEQVVADAGGPDDRRWATVYQLLAESLIRTGRYTDAETVARRLEDCAQRWDEPQHRAMALRVIANARLLRGQPDGAEGLLFEARGILRERRVYGELGRCELALGLLWKDSRPPSQTRKRFQAARRTLGKISDNHGIARAYLAEAQLLLEIGDRAGANTLLSKAASIFKESSDRNGVADTILYQGRVALASDDKNGAYRAFEEASAVYRSIGAREGMALCLLESGRVLSRNGRRSDAHKCFERALSEFIALGSRSRAALAHLELNRLAIDNGEFERSAQRLRELFPELRKAAGRRGAMISLVLSSRCSAELKQWPEADDDLYRAAKILRRLRLAEDDLARQLERIGELAARANQTVIAQTALTMAMGMWQRLDRTNEVKRIEETYGG